jgi:hypothetical protein
VAKTKYAAVSPATFVTTNGGKDTSEGEVERGLISLTARLPVLKIGRVLTLFKR